MPFDFGEDFQLPTEKKVGTATWGDVGRQLGSSAVELATQAASAGQYAAGRAGMPETARFMRGLSRIGGAASDSLREDITEGGKRAAEAEFIPGPGRQSVFDAPGSSAWMKLAGALPSLGAIGGAAALSGGVGAAGVGTALQMGQVIDQTQRLINSMDDGELTEKIPAYAKLRSDGMDEEAARTALAGLMVTNTDLLGAAAAGALGAIPMGRALTGAASVGRGTIKGAFGGAMEAAAGMALGAGQADYAGQSGRIAAGMQDEIDYGQIAHGAVNAALEGGVLGGAMGAVHGQRAAPGPAPLPPLKPRTSVEKVDAKAPDAAATQALTGKTAPVFDVDVQPAPKRGKRARAKEATAPEAPKPPVTETGNEAPPPGGEVPKVEDAGQTVPEKPATFKEQIAQLIAGDRAAVLFPKGSKGRPPLPEGMKAVYTSEGSFYYDPKRLKAKDIYSAIAEDRLNEILELGPVSKTEALARQEQGEAPIAVTERTPDGTEVKAAAGTEETAAAQAKALEENKTEGNTVQVEPVEQVLADRVTPEAPRPPRQDISTLGDLGGGAVDSMFDMLWSKVREGSTVEAGQPSALLIAAKRVREAGGLQDVDQLRAFAADYAKIRESGKSGAEYQAAMRELVGRWSPEAPKPPAPPEAPVTPPVTPAEAPTAAAKVAAVKEKAKAAKEPKEPKLTEAQKAQAEAEENYASLTDEQRTQVEQRVAAFRESSAKLGLTGAKLDAAVERQRRVETEALLPKDEGEPAVARKSAPRTGEAKPSKDLKRNQVRRDTNARADDVAGKFLPGEDEKALGTGGGKGLVAMAALQRRLTAMLQAADEAGIKLPDRLKTNADPTLTPSPGLTLLVEARDLLRAAKKRGGVSNDHIADFTRTEWELRQDGEAARDRVLEKRREEGDLRKKQTTDATETAAPKDEGDAELTGESGFGRLEDAPEVESNLTGKARQEGDSADEMGVHQVVGKAEDIGVTTTPDAEVTGEGNAPVVREREKVQLKGDEVTAGKDATGSGVQSVTKGRFEIDPETGKRVFRRARKTSLLDDVTDPVTGETAAPIETLSARAMLDRLKLDDAKGISGALARAIRNAFMRVIPEDLQVHILDSADFDRLTGSKTASGAYLEGDHGKPMIVVRDTQAGNDARMQHVILHEATHAVMQEALRRSLDVRNGIRDIADAVEGWLKTEGTAKEREAFAYALRKDDRGLINPHEFLAEAFSNKTVQNALGQIEAPKALLEQLGYGDKKPMSLFDAVKAMIRRTLETLGLPKKAVSMMELSLHIGDELIYRSGVTPEGKSFGPGSIAFKRWFGESKVVNEGRSSQYADLLENIEQRRTTVSDRRKDLEENRQRLAQARESLEESKRVEVSDWFPQDIKDSYIKRGVESVAFWEDLVAKDEGFVKKAEDRLFVSQDRLYYALGKDNASVMSLFVRAREAEDAGKADEAKTLYKQLDALANTILEGDSNPRVVYHGVGQGGVEIQEFLKKKLGLSTGAASAKEGFFFAGKPETSEAYVPHATKLDTGGVIQPAYLRIENPLIHDMKGSHYRETTYYDLIKQAKAEGRDGVIIKNTYDGGPMDDIFVVFEPEQIKSALSNAGTYDPRDARISFLDDDGKPTVKSAAEAMARQASDTGINLTSLRKKVLNKVRSLDNIARAADRIFGGADNNPIRKIQETVETIRVAAQKNLEASEPVIKKMDQLQRKHTVSGQWALFTELQHDANMLNVHPDVDLKHARNKHVSEGIRDVQSRLGHAELADRFAKLDPELQGLWREATDYFAKQQNAMAQKLLTNHLMKALVKADPAKREEVAQRFFDGKETEADIKLIGQHAYDALKNVNELRRLKGPYFPQMRRGDFVVTAEVTFAPPKDGKKLDDGAYAFDQSNLAADFAREVWKKHGLKATVRAEYYNPETGKTYFVDTDGTQVRASKLEPDAAKRFVVDVPNRYVSFHETMAEAQRHAADMAEQGYKSANAAPRRFEQTGRSMDMLSSQMRALMARVEGGRAYKDLTDAEKEAFKQALDVMSLQMLGSTRVQSRRMPRNFVQGASRDVTRNTLDYAQSMAAHLAKLDHQPTIDEALIRARELARDGTDNAGRTEILNEVEQRLAMPEYVASNTSPAMNRILQLSFLDKLFSPAYNLINMTQPIVNTVPLLAARHGWGATTSAMTRAYSIIGGGKNLATGAANTVRAAKGKETTDVLASMRDRLGKAGEQYVRLFDYLEGKGAIGGDAGLEVAKSIRRADGMMGKVDAGINYADAIARALPEAIEVNNRMASAVAAFDLEIKKGASEDAAMRKALDVVNQTQFNYSATNAPTFMKHPLAKVFFQFKKYAQGQYQFLGEQIATALRDADPAARKEAAKVLMNHALMVTAFAGAVGLPTEPIKALLLATAPVTGFTPQDFEREIEKLMPEVLSRGLSRGIPGGFAFDLSSRMGENSMLTFGTPKSYKSDDVKAWLFDNLKGAPAGLVEDWVTGVNGLLTGDSAKQVESVGKLIPIKMFSDTLDAYRKATEGKTNARGQQKMAPYSPQEAMVRAMGFTPAREANTRAAQSYFYDKSRELKDERSELTSAYLKGKTGDERTKAWARIVKWNASQAPEARITREQLTQLEKSDRKAEQSGKLVNGVRVTKQNERFLREGNQIYGVQ